MAITATFTCDDEIRETQISALSVAEVQDAALHAFPELPAESFVVKYFDEEDDLCLLSLSASSDFVALHQGDSTIYLHVMKKTSHSPMQPGSTQQPSVPKHPNTFTGQRVPPRVLGEFVPLLKRLSDNVDKSGGKMPSFQSYLPELLFGPKVDRLATLFMKFAPAFVQSQRHSNAQDELDKDAAQKPELANAVLQAICARLEPFSELCEVIAAVERMLRSESIKGFGKVVIMFLEAFAKSPEEHQREIALVLVSNLVDKVGEVREERKAAQQILKAEKDASKKEKVVEKTAKKLEKEARKEKAAKKTSR